MKPKKGDTTKYLSTIYKQNVIDQERKPILNVQWPILQPKLEHSTNTLRVRAGVSWVAEMFQNPILYYKPSK
jgi:hypothetical protein